MPTVTQILVADQCWIALAGLHREHPRKVSFTAREISDRVARDAGGAVRAGVQPHIYLHNVANLAPSSGRYRMFYRLDNGSYRLFRPEDYCHPSRRGKTKPKSAELPPEYHELLSWYENEYCARGGPGNLDEDPVLRMLGVGRELWLEEGGDEFIARERREWEGSQRE